MCFVQRSGRAGAADAAAPEDGRTPGVIQIFSNDYTLRGGLVILSGVGKIEQGFVCARFHTSLIEIRKDLIRSLTMEKTAENSESD